MGFLMKKSPRKQVSVLSRGVSKNSKIRTTAKFKEIKNRPTEENEEIFGTCYVRRACVKGGQVHKGF